MKKKIVLSTVFCVLHEDTLTASFTTFEKAEREAKDKLEMCEDADVKILEVVGAWTVGWLPEPVPEIWEIGLEEL